MHSFFLATIAIYLLYLNDAFEVHPSGLRGRPTPTFTAQQRKFQREMLQAHNAHRKRHCASPLRLDDRLSRSAQNYAQRLATIKTMVHSGTKGLGENLYFKSSSNQITEINGQWSSTDPSTVNEHFSLRQVLRPLKRGTMKLNSTTSNKRSSLPRPVISLK